MMSIIFLSFLQEGKVTLPDDIALIGLLPLSVAMSYIVDLLKKLGYIPNEGRPKKLIATAVAAIGGALGLGSYYATGPIVGEPGPVAVLTHLFIGFLVGFAAVGYKSTVKNALEARE